MIMSEREKGLPLSWQSQHNRLTLSGDLDRETLLPLWTQYKAMVLEEINEIDVSQLNRVDSAGLALLVQFIEEATSRKRNLVLTGITDRLNTLITLYNLQHIIRIDSN